MPVELAVLIPSRGRPGNIEKVISAWDFTNAWDVADMWVIVDADDPEIDGYRALEDETACPMRLVVMGTWMPMVHKLNEVARDVAEGWPGTERPPFALGFAGDDHLPQTINWAKRYLAVLHELKTGMVYGDDGYQGFKLSTEWAVTSDAVRALHRMVPADVEHMYCDNAIMDLFSEAGALRHLPEVRIEHHHPVAGKAASDEQYERVNGREQFARDRRGYQAWTTTQKPLDVAVIKALRRGLPEVRPHELIKIDTRKKKARAMNMPFPRHIKKVPGGTPDEISLTLADFARQVPADQEIVEIGVYRARNTMIMAWGAREGLGAHVTGIDPWDLEGNVYDPPFNQDSSRKWARYHIQSLAFANDIRLIQAFSQDVAETWDEHGKPVGLLFVDGDHSYEGARSDITMWAGHLADGALIAVDDYGHPDWPGVKEAVDALVAENFLEPIQIFHDRLAVTRLANPQQRENILPRREDGTLGDGPADPFEHADGAPCSDEWCEDKQQAITSEGVSPSPEPLPIDGAVSKRMVVDTFELTSDPKVRAGQPITELNTTQLRALAKERGISLGARKDKRDEMLAALEAGE